jgi:hypothetical protein
MLPIDDHAVSTQSIEAFTAREEGDAVLVHGVKHTGICSPHGPVTDHGNRLDRWRHRLTVSGLRERARRYREKSFSAIFQRAHQIRRQPDSLGVSTTCRGKLARGQTSPFPTFFKQTPDICETGVLNSTAVRMPCRGSVGPFGSCPDQF